MNCQSAALEKWCLWFENLPLRPLSVLCVFAVDLHVKKVHRWDAENAEGAQRVEISCSRLLFAVSDRSAIHFLQVVVTYRGTRNFQLLLRQIQMVAEHVNGSERAGKAQLLDGALVANEIKQQVQRKVEQLVLEHDVRPGLAAIRVGDDRAS